MPLGLNFQIAVKDTLTHRKLAVPMAIKWTNSINLTLDNSLFNREIFASELFLLIRSTLDSSTLSDFSNSVTWNFCHLA